MNKKKTFRLATLGCRTNQYETQGFRDQLLTMGFVEAEAEEKADICIVNTCTVTENADKASLSQVRQFAREHPGSKLVVTGCLAERPSLFHEISESVHVVANKHKESLLSQLFPEEDVPEFSITHFAAHTRAFVKVQDGCNSFCTYCIIPYVRGRSKSRPIADILHEVKNLIDSGYKDIVITGINVGDFQDGDKTLADLIREVDKLDGIERLRLSSIDPDEVNDDLMDAILNGKHTCPSMHIVLQSGSNVILKRMNRKYTRQIFLNSVERLKKASSDFTFTTDVIVGFPGETESDFEETVEVVKEVQFAKVHMFPFSRRERTRAFHYPNQVKTEVIKERKSRLLRLAEDVAFKKREQFVGRKMSILTENSEEGKAMGHTSNFLAVFVNENYPANRLIDVELVENTPEGLLGIPV